MCNATVHLCKQDGQFPKADWQGNRALYGEGFFQPSRVLRFLGWRVVDTVRLARGEDGSASQDRPGVRERLPVAGRRVVKAHSQAP